MSDHADPRTTRVASKENTFDTCTKAPEMFTKRSRFAHYSRLTPSGRLRRILRLRQNAQVLENKAMPAVMQRAVEFPQQRGTCFKVFSPNSTARFMWDMFMLFCTIFIMVATPFELAFVNSDEGCMRTITGMVIVNLLIDLCFFIDMRGFPESPVSIASFRVSHRLHARRHRLLQLNTSYFDSVLGEWILSRTRILYRYARTWFLIDLMSIMPLECIANTDSTFEYMRLVRAMRFFKLLKVIKSPRILRAASRHFDISSKVKTIVKYLSVLFFVIHWSACLLRLLTWVACQTGNGRHSLQGEYRDDDNFNGCPNTVLTTSYNWGDGIWAAYMTSALWSNMALNGDASAYLHSEAVLAICIMLIGERTLPCTVVASTGF